MITSLKFNNCFAFNNTIEMSLKADMRTKKFSSNVININDNLNILKSAVVYGPNNTGKTTLINCMKAIKETLLNKKIHLDSNIFIDSSICEEEISFIYGEKEYLYEYKFDAKKRMYIYKHYILFSVLTKQKHPIKNVNGLINKLIVGILYIPGKIATKVKIK